eukprot:gene773-524_t
MDTPGGSCGSMEDMIARATRQLDGMIGRTKSNNQQLIAILGKSRAEQALAIPETPLKKEVPPKRKSRKKAAAVSEQSEQSDSLSPVSVAKVPLKRGRSSTATTKSCVKPGQKRKRLLSPSPDNSRSHLDIRKPKRKRGASLTGFMPEQPACSSFVYR